LLLIYGTFDHLPKGTIKQDLEEAKASFQVVSHLFDEGKSDGQIKDLPEEVLRALSFETCATLARDQL
jgi:hypothetical protein